MLNQAFDSIIVGGAISVAMFLPVLIWQYRRYGAFQPARTLWTIVTFVYTTALITYTLFPLPDMTGDYCATHPQVFVLDPTIYFREMAQRLAGLGLSEALLTWDVLQMVFNVALFVPLGVILSDFVELKAGWAIPVGLGVSLLVEATQFTGNWGLMPCAYRVADVNDLITNTTGTVVGYLIALLIPRFITSPAQLRARRLQARPVTVWRRWTGMLLDLTYWTICWVSAMSVVSIAVFVITGQSFTDAAGNPRPQVVLVWNLTHVLLAILLIVLPTLIGNGASLGQRTVYLRPVGGRWRLIARALVVQGVAVCLPALGLAASGLGLLWVGVAVVSVLATRRGLSCVITGCQLMDARAGATTAPLPAASEEVAR